MDETNELTRQIVDAAYTIHSGIGPGLFESVYESLLEQELKQRGLKVERQKPVSFDYNGLHFEDGFKVDLLVEGRVVVELKAVEKLAPVHPKQVLTYLRLMNLPVGLLINFGAPTLKEGVKRVANNLLRDEPLRSSLCSSASLRDAVAVDGPSDAQSV